jgi:hypothetical protein
MGASGDVLGAQGGTRLRPVERGFHDRAGWPRYPGPAARAAVQPEGHVRSDRPFEQTVEVIRGLDLADRRRRSVAACVAAASSPTWRSGTSSIGSTTHPPLPWALPPVPRLRSDLLGGFASAAAGRRRRPDPSRDQAGVAVRTGPRRSAAAARGAGCSTSAMTRLDMNRAVRTGPPERVTSLTSTRPRRFTISTRRPARVAVTSNVRESDPASMTISTRSPFTPPQCA